MNLPQHDHPAFKKCPLCSFSWETRSDFLADPHIEIIGYQACFRELTAGSFLFNHSCTGTLAIRVKEFADLYGGIVHEGRKTETDECPEYCLHSEELTRCPARCECAFVREIIQLVRQWPKTPSEDETPVRA